MATNHFEEIVVAVSGTHQGYKQGEPSFQVLGIYPTRHAVHMALVADAFSIADLKDLVEGLGAKFTPSVTTDCTHLVTTQKDVEKKSTKCMCGLALPTTGLLIDRGRTGKAAVKGNCHIVSLDWLLQSQAASKPLAKDPYILDSDQDGIGQGSQKDAISTDTITDLKDGQADCKKAVMKDSTATTQTGTKRGADQTDATEDEPKKKAKDAQKTSSKFLSIPVDEAFFDEKLYFPRKRLQLFVGLTVTNPTRCRSQGTHRRFGPYLGCCLKSNQCLGQ